MNSGHPCVSVVMAVYNTRLQYLKKAVESILEQTYDNIEFVIVDDGSTNIEVKKYLQSVQLADNRIKLVINEENAGLTCSLNIGIDNSSGEYIARMDSDDISLPDRIRKQVAYMEAHRDVCMTGTETLIITDTDEQGELCERGHMSDQIVCEIHLLYENEGYAHSTFMLRKSFLDDKGIRYREEIKRAQDYALTTDCILAGGRRFLIGEPLLKYRMHKESISGKLYDEQIEFQALTGFRRLRETFYDLTDDECWAIARINHESQKYPPHIVINAINKVFIENRDRHLFNSKILKREFYYEWYKKVMRITRINKRPWGMFELFTIKAIPSVVAIKLDERYCRIAPKSTKRNYSL